MVTLFRDGSTLRLQAPTPVDLDDIKAFYDGLSPDSRYLRVHGFGRTDTVARADAEATAGDRLALISRRSRDDRDERGAEFPGLGHQRRAVLEAISVASAGAAQAGGGISAAVQRPVACAHRLGRTDLPVPRVVCCRARWRRRTSRMVVMAARRAPHYRDLDGPAARAVISSFLDREPAGRWPSLAPAEALLATRG